MTDSKPVRFKLPNPACPNDPEAWIEVETTEETRDLLRTHPDFVDNAPVGHIVRVVGSSGDMNQVPTEEVRELLRKRAAYSADNGPTISAEISAEHLARSVDALIGSIPKADPPKLSASDLNRLAKAFNPPARGPVPGRRTSGRSKSKRVKRKQVRKSRRANRGK